MLLRLLTPRALGLALFAAGSVLAACSSTGGGAPDAVGRPGRIRFDIGSSQKTFELVNETHTGRVELYSTARSNADTKVQTDEVVDEVLEHFGKLGLYERTQPGGAPHVDGETYSGALEIDVAGEPMHFAVGPGSAVEDQILFKQCLQTFLLVYNETYQLQAVERHPDWSPSLQKPQ